MRAYVVHNNLYLYGYIRPLGHSAYLEGKHVPSLHLVSAVFVSLVTSRRGVVTLCDIRYWSFACLHDDDDDDDDYERINYRWAAAEVNANRSKISAQRHGRV